MSVEAGLCECGCGGAAPISPVSHKRMGYVKGQPRRFIRGHSGTRVEVPEPNPSGLCMCGCGERTPLASRGSTEKGWIVGRPIRFVPGHSARLRRRKGPDFVVNESGCWIWQFSRSPSGYGQVWHEGKLAQAHRIYYEKEVGPIPTGLDLDHLCRVRACVNPEHLEPVTRAVNARRGNGARLTEAQVREIRSDTQTSGPVLAERYGVKKACIHSVRNGSTWKDVV